MGHKLKLELHLFWLFLRAWCCYPLFLFAFASVLLFVYCCSPLHVWCCFPLRMILFSSSFLCIHCISPIRLLLLSSSHVVLFPSSHGVAFLFVWCYFPCHACNVFFFFMCYCCFLCEHYYCPFYMRYCSFLYTWCCSSFHVLLIFFSSLITTSSSHMLLFFSSHATILLFVHIVALLFALKYKVPHYCSSLHLQFFSSSRAIVLFLVCYYSPFHAIAPMLLFVKRACTTPFHSFLQVGSSWGLIT